MRSLHLLTATAILAGALASCDSGTGPDDANDDPCSVTGNFEVTGNRQARGTLRYGFYVSTSLSGSVLRLEPKFGADSTISYPSFHIHREEPNGFQIGTYDIGDARMATPRTAFVAEAQFMFPNGTADITYKSIAGSLVIDTLVDSRVGGRLSFEAEDDVHVIAEFLVPHVSPICD